jgi:hypothetical protein
MGVNKVVRYMIVTSLCVGAGITVAQNQTSPGILQGSAPKAEYLIREAREYFAPYHPQMMLFAAQVLQTHK